jgi:radical SAM protein with 4Fe4S-binding SPASM domain
MLYSGIGILVDGTATVCPCRDLNGDSDLVIGNINKASLYDIYYSEALEQLRTNWHRGKHIPNVCKDCNHYNPYTYMMLNKVKRV